MDLVVKAEKLIEFSSKQEWVIKCPRMLPPKKHKNEKFLFIDRNGFSLEIGKHFDIADEIGSFPITVYRLQTISLLG